MSETLESLFEREAAPARDALFRITLMERVARRRFVFTLMTYSIAALIGLICLWSLAGPMGAAFEPVARSFEGMSVWLGALAITAFAGAWIVSRGGRIPYFSRWV